MVDNTQNILDSRDVIERLEELQMVRETYVEEIEDCENTAKDTGDERTQDEHNAADAALAEARAALVAWDAGDDGNELRALIALAEEGENSPDWNYGETLIREDYFTSYIEELIADCYPTSKEMNSGDWPWRHMSLDYDAAADEARADYFELDFAGVTYLLRA